MTDNPFDRLAAHGRLADAHRDRGGRRRARRLSRRLLRRSAASTRSGSSSACRPPTAPSTSRRAPRRSSSTRSTSVTTRSRACSARRPRPTSEVDKFLSCDVGARARRRPRARRVRLVRGDACATESSSGTTWASCSTSRDLGEASRAGEPRLGFQGVARSRGRQSRVTDSVRAHTHSRRVVTDRVRYRTFMFDSARWDGFEFRDDDIVISTSPKCGTTWTQMLCALLIFQDSALRPSALSQISPWLDQQTRKLDTVLATLDAQQHRRFIKTHTPFDGLPLDDRVTYLCVGRDPRDVFLSMDHHWANMDMDAVRQRTRRRRRQRRRRGAPVADRRW